MNLNQLEYFISLSESLNFTKAAESCFISQTAMTQQIKALEKTVGVPLFIRDKHHVELTAAGKVYLQEAKTIIKRSDEAILLARLASEGVEGELNIGYVSGLGQNFLVSPLQSFHKSYPSVKISIFSKSSSTLFDSLTTGESDVIFTVAQRTQEHKNMKYKYLTSFPVMAVLPAIHPLAERENLTYKELQHEQFIMMEPSDRPKDMMEESILIYERGGYYPEVLAMEKNPETLILMIAIGMGISILPEYITNAYKSDQDIRIIPLTKEDGSTESIDLEVAWLENNINPVLEHLLTLLGIPAI